MKYVLSSVDADKIKWFELTASDSTLTSFARNYTKEYDKAKKTKRAGITDNFTVDSNILRSCIKNLQPIKLEPKQAA